MNIHPPPPINALVSALESFNTFGKVKFYHYPVSRITLDEAMKEAELENIKVEVFEIGHLKLGETTDATALFFAMGRMSDSENVIIHKRTLKK